jgi:hypothetical protein
MVSFPVISYPTLHGTIVRASGTPATGRVLIGVTATTQDPSSDVVIGLQTDILPLVDGEFSSAIPAVPDGEGPKVVVTILLDDAPPDGYVFEMVTEEGAVELADIPGLESMYLTWRVERPF